MKLRLTDRQRGATLLEGIFGILIFSIGILAIIGLQANAIRQSSDAKYRTDAALLANELVGRMWISARTDIASLQNEFNTGKPGYEAWQARVAQVLPGASGDHVPEVDVADDGIVTITLYWKQPNESDADPPHNHVVHTQIQLREGS